MTDLTREQIAELLARPYEPPALFIFEEVEIGGGYHTLRVSHLSVEQAWSEPYQKSGTPFYRSRVVRVLFPPETSRIAELERQLAEAKAALSDWHTSHYMHSDPEGKAGLACPACIADRELRQRLRAALDATRPTRESDDG